MSVLPGSREGTGWAWTTEAVMAIAPSKLATRRSGLSFVMALA
jgi:hypothetical protein